MKAALRSPPWCTSRGGFCVGSAVVAGLESPTVDEVAEIVILVGLASLLAYATTLGPRRRAQLRKAPSGSRQTVTLKVMLVGDVIQQWGRLGYDLHERSDFAGLSRGSLRVPETFARLTFIKR